MNTESSIIREADTIRHLIRQYLNGQLSHEENGLLQDWLAASPQNRRFFEEITDKEQFTALLHTYNRNMALLAKDGIPDLFLNDSVAVPDSRSASVPRIPFLRKWGWVAAAVLILAVGITTAVVMSSDQRQNKSGTGLTQTAASDILPGTNRAILTVDNKRIDLASDKTGIRVGETIAYNDGEKLSDAGKTLMLATPNGGQYQLVLPDGTKAWLNAASSIRFPSVFSTGKREIKVTGEVFMEVAKDKSKPFFVDVNGQVTVQVLGTSFNINSYSDEGEIRTTLIEGSVKVSNSVSDQVILKPGYQAAVAYADRQLSPASQTKSNNRVLVQSADLSETLAWKNGLFSFNNADLRSVMKQLERWYDINVQYEGKNSSIVVDGKIFRNVKLSDVLEFLGKLGLKYRIEGKTLIVL